MHQRMQGSDGMHVDCGVRRCARRQRRFRGGGHGIAPVAFAGEGIAGQCEAARRGATGTQLRPVDGGALRPPSGDRVDIALGQRGVQSGSVVIERGDLVAMVAHQRAMRACACCSAGDDRVERGAQVVARARHDGQTHLHRLAAGLQRPGQRVERQRLVRVQCRAQVAGTLQQLFRRARRQRHQHRHGLIGHRGGGAIFLDQHVRVRATRAERGNAGDARTFDAVDDRARPGAQGLHHFERRRREVDVRIEGARMQRGHDLAMAHLQQHLGHTGDAGSGLAVADVRLGRADQAPACVLRCFTALRVERARQGVDLDRVAQLRAGAVRLDVADMARIDTRFAQRAGDDVGLCLRVRHGVAIGLAAVVQCGRADHAEDAVAVALGIRQALEHRDADALARDVAIAAFAEALAVAIAGDELAAAEHRVLVRMHADIDAACQGQRGASEAQILAGQVQRGQRGRAHGVEREARSMQVEEVRDTVGDAGEAAGQAVLAVHHAGIHADLSGQAVGVRHLQGGAGQPGVFEREPGVLQEQAFLRIDADGFARRNVEEPRIELVHALDEAAPAAEVRALAGGILAVPLLPVPARRRHFGDAVAAVAQIAPEGVQVGRLRIAPAQADDRDRCIDRGESGGRRRHARRIARAATTARGTLRHRQLRCRRRCRYRCRRSRCGGCRWGLREQPCQRIGMARFEIAREFVDRLVFEEQRLRQHAEAVFESTGQAHGQDRVDPVLLERGAQFDPLRRNLQHRREFVAEEGPEPRSEVRWRCGRRLRDVRSLCRRGVDGQTARGQRFAHCLALAVHDHQRGLRHGQRGMQGAQSGAGVHRTQAGALFEPAQALGIDMHAAFDPVRPGQGQAATTAFALRDLRRAPA